MLKENMKLGGLVSNWQLPKLEPKEIQENALDIMKLRYFIDLPENKKETEYSQLCRRVSRTIAAFDINYATPVPTQTVEKSIYNDMMSHRFLFNSPALFSAGVGISTDPELYEVLYKDDPTPTDYLKIVHNKSKNQMMFACFTISIHDSIEGIFDSVKNAAIISKYGGGVGANFGNLREKNSPIAGGCGGKASGPISFMELWNTMGTVVVQGGKRRAALMGMLNSHHPDIEEFIECKTKDGNLRYFNISVAIDNKFMEAVFNDDIYELISPRDLKIVGTVKARELWDKICTAAHKHGDPGIFFIDISNSDSLLKKLPQYNIETTNPCGEQPLPNETSCNLGSINLEAFVEDGKFNFAEFSNQVFRAIYYLDLVIDATSYPLDIIEDRTKAIRPIGLGIMGLADACIRLNIKYGSDEFIDFCNKIAKILAKNSLIASAAIADIKGPFKLWDSVSEMLIKDGLGFRPNLSDIKTYNDALNAYCDMHIIVDYLNKSSEVPISFKSAINAIYEDVNTDDDKVIFTLLMQSIFNGNGLRNSRRLSIAPTGTISLLLNTSSSIEPNFAYEWTRTIVVDSNEKKDLKYYHKLYNSSNLEAGLLISAYDLTPMQHVEAVKIFAPYIDSGISKTVNLPSDATVEDVKKVYEYCYKNNIKGITIYRDGSRSEQPIKRKTDTNKTDTDGKILTKIDSNINEIKNLEVSLDTPVKPDLKSSIKSRPKIIHGVTTKSDSPFGSIYITANFDEDGNMFETFINAGKSGSVSKSITEALSRVISLALRNGVKIEDIIKTINNISGSEIWVYDTIDGKEVIVKSIPDAAGKMLEDLNKYYKKMINNNKFNTNKKIEPNNSYNEPLSHQDDFRHTKAYCPECGSKMIPGGGCSICPSCGWSSCR